MKQGGLDGFGTQMMKPKLTLVPDAPEKKFNWDMELGKPFGEINGSLASFAANNPIPEICPKCGTTKRGERHACYSPAPADFVNRPPHYTKGKIEAIEIIEQVVKDYPSDVAYHIGNALKYQIRAPHKGALKQDIQKAIAYLNRAEKML